MHGFLKIITTSSFLLGALAAPGFNPPVYTMITPTSDSTLSGWQNAHSCIGTINTQQVIQSLVTNCYNFGNTALNVKLLWPDKGKAFEWVTMYQGYECKATAEAPHNVTVSKDSLVAADGTGQCLPVPSRDGKPWTDKNNFGSILLGSGTQPANFEDGW